MPISKATSYVFLSDARFSSEARGISDVIDSLAGRTRNEYELLTGQNPFPSEQPASKLNPQRELGHDHSGPPWGTAFLHPLASIGGMKSSSANRTGDRQVIAALTKDAPFTIAWPFFNRRFQDIGPSVIAPYARGYLSFVASLSGAGSVDVTVLGTARNDATGPFTFVDGDLPSQTFTVSSTSETTFTTSTLFFPLRPRRNCLLIRFKSSASSPSVIITAMSILQTVKRSH